MTHFERIDSKPIFEGRIITVTEQTFRYDDGKTADREIVTHKGAVAIVAHDDEHVFLIRQPREAVGSASVLELPAGLLDKPGEPPEETAKRELAEEIGKAATDWELLHTFYTSVGFSNEQVRVYLATGLSDIPRPDSGEDERIELVPWPLRDLDAAIDACEDSKTLIGLLELARRLA
jgi:8-oxo-dGTP pyrophosphatase MutT (NUDIX family)